MLSSSISSSSSSSSSSRSISLSPESSCRKASRIHDRFSSQMARHLCQLKSKGWCCWLMLSSSLPCGLCNHTPGGYGGGPLSSLVWIPDLDLLRGAAADSARCFVPAQAAALLAFQNNDRPELSCLWELMAHMAFTSSSPLG